MTDAFPMTVKGKRYETISDWPDGQICTLFLGIGVGRVRSPQFGWTDGEMVCTAAVTVVAVGIYGHRIGLDRRCDGVHCSSDRSGRCIAREAFVVTQMG